MSVFAIGDLHLPGHEQKPMDVFGSHWDRHFETISENWVRKIRPEDVVLIPGDISWAMQLSEAQDDLNAIGQLPGTKLLLRGNHDYWWSSLAKLRAALREELKDTTVILIAQRIASVRDADRIAVIEDGRIRHCAPHDELMRVSETYRDIYASQMERGGAANE